ncbi:GtrA family protein [Methyloceanibacter sp.]|uniref:GtrA family protein n=1 Tax=Methyloceanibacter sp. TaxID=1965321 RepID=UPI003D6D77E9
MKEDKDATSSLARAELTRFLRYCVVGAAGFITDATVLLALVHGFAMNPLLARVFSFSLAVMLTFALNQHWTFGGGRKQGLIASFAAYLGVQGLGLVCNAAIFAIGILVLPAPLNAPLFSLAIASAIALAVNYGGAKHFVFNVDARGER